MYLFFRFFMTSLTSLVVWEKSNHSCEAVSHSQVIWGKVRWLKTKRNTGGPISWSAELWAKTITKPWRHDFNSHSGTPEFNSASSEITTFATISTLWSCWSTRGEGLECDVNCITKSLVIYTVKYIESYWPTIPLMHAICRPNLIQMSSMEFHKRSAYAPNVSDVSCQVNKSVLGHVDVLSNIPVPWGILVLF